MRVERQERRKKEDDSSWGCWREEQVQLIVADRAYQITASSFKEDFVEHV